MQITGLPFMITPLKNKLSATFPSQIALKPAYSPSSKTVGSTAAFSKNPTLSLPPFMLLYATPSSIRD